MNTVFDIEQKQDSAEKLAKIAQDNIESRYILFADEFNGVKNQAIQNAIDNIKLNFFWNADNKRDSELPYCSNVWLLGLEIKDKGLFEKAANVKLIIDRFRNRRDGTGGTAKFKHPVNINPEYPLRKSEIVLTEPVSWLDFGQEYYFKQKISHDGLPSIRATGTGQRFTSRNGSHAIVYLQFRLRVIVNGLIYVSQPLGRISMISSMDGANINYKII